MPAGWGGVRPGSGRRKGTKNKAVIEREAAAKMAERVALERERLKAEDAAREMIIVKTAGRKLAKEVGEDFLTLFAGLAAVYQPLPDLKEGEAPPEGRMPDELKFNRYAKLAMEMVKALLPYQSPALSAVMIAPPPSEPTEGERRRRFTLTVFEGGKALLPAPSEEPSDE